MENASPRLREVMAVIADAIRSLPPGRLHSVGITGSPGVGKSTLVSELVAAYRQRRARVGVLAVDPSSPFSGGAVLGDRVRMQQHATDPGVFIRSMAARGHLGGLSWATPQALRVLEAVGFDVVLVETVGVGQSEVEVADLADTTVVVLAPGLGDGIQAAKAGILEVGDAFVVNKADREGARRVVRDLHGMLGSAATLPATDSLGWTPPVLLTTAEKGEGVDAVLAALGEHREWLRSSGRLAERRRRQAQAEVEALAAEEFLRQARAALGSETDRLASQVALGEMDPYRAADRYGSARRRDHHG